jgi:hypothetical protein
MFTPLPSFGDVFELRVCLRHIEPVVWRSLRVPATLPLNYLHDALQLAFGWKDCHLHDFRVGDISFGLPSLDDGMLSVHESAAPVGAVARAGSTFLYTYDFGDDWEHDITVERMERQPGAGIVCTGGARACPPEDCGGPLGYQLMLEALADPRSERHAEMKAWVPRAFNAEKFDLAAVNKKLTTLSKRIARLMK